MAAFRSGQCSVATRAAGGIVLMPFRVAGTVVAPAACQGGLETPTPEAGSGRWLRDPSTSLACQGEPRAGYYRPRQMQQPGRKSAETTDARRGAHSHGRAASVR